jgi:hypothetical protein
MMFAPLRNVEEPATQLLRRYSDMNKMHRIVFMQQKIIMAEFFTGKKRWLQ